MRENAETTLVSVQATHDQTAAALEGFRVQQQLHSNMAPTFKAEPSCRSHPAAFRVGANAATDAFMKQVSPSEFQYFAMPVCEGVALTAVERERHEELLDVCA